MINEKIGKRFVEKARDSVIDDNEHVGQNSAGSKSFLGDIISSVIDMVGDAVQKDSTASHEGNRKSSGRKPGVSTEGHVASVASNVADQLRRKK